ncbi:hypothetical protein AMATHDRAFT_53537 [Amanita thiersii Skay4041]|uniref:RING-type domain-containing protein n=1 Tax=Amanita thiersii Skay4041 TaxID=703135 RepID=A0A2A9P0J0_9AGAR|nr:hypothetical protein AMATHDRAFT_53537 [Amanita thiersii Skay4041]
MTQEEPFPIPISHSESLRDSISSHSRPLSTTNLKRHVSPSCDSELPSEGSRKRFKEDITDETSITSSINCTSVKSSLIEELATELQCGCCSELAYRPVLVIPCQHFFCGSCCYLWIRNSGTNCPACRQASDAVVPFRPLQAMIDTLLRAAPSKARTERERQQADEVYTGQPLRLPRPKEASPEPNINQNNDYARPCPYCLDNPSGYRCPQPIPDPTTDPDHAWHLDDGVPPGHAHCGNCENLLALRAPTTTKCDLCQVSFCGVGVPGRCVAAPLLSQHPHGMSDISDLIQSPDIYECFDSNTVEVEIMFDYLTSQRLTPRHIYREVVTYILSQPRGFQPLIELDLFNDVHGVAAGIDPNPQAPRNKICRICSSEVLLYGLKDWWVRERQKGFLEESILSRKDCPDGNSCTRQKILAHAREFNHILPTSLMGSQGGPSPEPVLNQAALNPVANPRLFDGPSSRASLQGPTSLYQPSPDEVLGETSGSSSVATGPMAMPFIIDWW